MVGPQQRPVPSAGDSRALNFKWKLKINSQRWRLTLLQRIRPLRLAWCFLAHSKYQYGRILFLDDYPCHYCLKCGLRWQH